MVIRPFSEAKFYRVRNDIQQDLLNGAPVGEQLRQGRVEFQPDVPPVGFCPGQAGFADVLRQFQQLECRFVQLVTVDVDLREIQYVADQLVQMPPGHLDLRQVIRLLHDGIVDIRARGPGTDEFTQYL